MKHIIIILLIATSAYAERPKTYVELQRERIALADAASRRFRADLEARAAAKAAADKAAADERARKLAAEKAYKRQLALAAAAAPKTYITQQQVLWW
jgi:hypothetical protein